MLRNAVRWSTNEDPPVEVNGPGVLDVSVWRQQGSLTVHLVNLTNPMMMKGPFRELIPVGEQQVVIRLPSSARARRVQLLREGRVLPGPWDGNRLRLNVPSIPRPRDRGGRSGVIVEVTNVDAPSSGDLIMKRREFVKVMGALSLTGLGSGAGVLWSTPSEYPRRPLARLAWR